MWFAAMGMLFCVTGAHAAPLAYSGSDLLRDCNSAVRWLDSGTYTSVDMLQGMRCEGYVLGVLDGYRTRRILDGLLTRKQKTPIIIICTPDQINNLEMARIVQKFVHDHPQYLTEDAADLIVGALANAFPCR
jgi:hypothetical protein